MSSIVLLRVLRPGPVSSRTYAAIIMQLRVLPILHFA